MEFASASPAATYNTRNSPPIIRLLTEGFDSWIFKSMNRVSSLAAWSSCSALKCHHFCNHFGLWLCVPTSATTRTLFWLCSRHVTHPRFCEGASDHNFLRLCQTNPRALLPHPMQVDGIGRISFRQSSVRTIRSQMHSCIKRVRPFRPLCRALLRGQNPAPSGTAGLCFVGSP